MGAFTPGTLADTTVDVSLCPATTSEIWFASLEKKGSLPSELKWKRGDKLEVSDSTMYREHGVVPRSILKTGWKMISGDNFSNDWVSM